MGVYIKGIEMPTSCYECRMYEADIYYCSTADRVIDIPDSSEGRCTFCPLVPVPPHGRLIDADALDSSATDYSGNHLVYLVDIDDAPTIIPAEEASDGKD